MWQAATLGGPKPYSSASSLPGFYSTGYPPTPPKDSQSDEPQAPARAAAGNSEEYINSSLSSSISSEDLMSNDMKPTPESLMGFHSFPYSSRKIQEGRFYWLTGSFFDYFYFYFILFCSSPVSSVNLCPVSSASDIYGGGGGPPPLEQTTSPHSPVYYSGNLESSYPPNTFPSAHPTPGTFHSKGLSSPRQRTKARSNAGKLCDLTNTTNSRPVLTALYQLTTSLTLSLTIILIL